MLQLISRNQIFKNSISADITIAGLQDAYAKNIDLDDPEGVSLLNLYDHRSPFNPVQEKENEHIVLALPTESKESFKKSFPEQLTKFFLLLDIHELYIMDWLKRSWNDFPFENSAKKEKFQQLVEDVNFSGGLKINVDQLNYVLDLLLFSSRFDQPVFYIFPAGSDELLSFYLCDDGNLHTNCTIIKSQHIQKVADEAGFKTGGFEICQVYSCSYWR